MKPNTEAFLWLWLAMCGVVGIVVAVVLGVMWAFSIAPAATTVALVVVICGLLARLLAS
jgi:hypothetical protein